MSDNRNENAERFLELIKKSKKGKFKVYVGMSAGVGKTYRMLQEAHNLLANGIDIKIGFVETHQRAETLALTEGLPILPRKIIFYKGKELEEMDLQAILNIRPEVVIVDELAHTNVWGSKNEKRWQDVLDILEAGINVISAVNIQHIESLNAEVEQITGIEITERVPDRVVKMADEVVNIDLTADELILRLKAGKIYEKSKIEVALRNFFQADKILQLRELALKEVAQQVERKIETEILDKNRIQAEKFLACISSNADDARKIIRKTARLASYYNSQWFVLYVQTSKESSDKISLSVQRHLINNFKFATQMGAEVLEEKSNEISKKIAEIAFEKKITFIVVGKPHYSFFKSILNLNITDQLLEKISELNIDLLVVS